MILLLLVLLEDANEEAIGIFNTLDNYKKILLLKLFSKVFFEEYDKEMLIYKQIYKQYENKKVELTILHEFGIEQGYVNEATSFFNDIDLQIDTHFENVNSIEDLT